MNLKEISKNIFQKLRIFPLAIFLIQFFSIHNIKIFFKALINYLYNNLLTFFPNHLVRIFYLKYILNIKIGENCFIHMGARFEGNITIGNNTVIGRRCVLIGSIIIMNNVSITAETYIFATSHIVNDPNFKSFYKTVIIKDYAWLGVRAIVQPGITIGKGAVLGSASIATKNIPDFAIFAGTPAKQIGTRSQDLTYVLKYSPFFQ